MDMSAISQIISSLGFPIFVAVFMLYKSSKDSEEMRATINDLRVAITELTTLIKSDRDEKE